MVAEHPQKVDRYWHVSEICLKKVRATAAFWRDAFMKEN